MVCQGFPDHGVSIRKIEIDGTRFLYETRMGQKDGRNLESLKRSNNGFEFVWVIRVLGAMNGGNQIWRVHIYFGGQLGHLNLT